MTQLSVTPPRSGRLAGSLWLGSALVVGHLLTLFGVGRVIAGPLLAGRDPFEGSGAAFLTLALVSALDFLVVVVIGLWRLAGVRLRDLGWERVSGGDLVLGLVGLVVALAALVGLMLLLLGHLGWLLPRMAAFTARQRLFFAALGASAAFFEETLFRGYLQPRLQARLGRWGGLVVTAVVFALYHFKLRPLPLAGKLALGLVYGGLRERTGRLWAPAIAHAGVWVVMGTL